MLVADEYANWPDTEEKVATIASHLQEILKVLKPDCEGDCHLVDTPLRYAKALVDLTTPEQFTFTTFENIKKYDEMIVVSHVPFASLCPHHLLPYQGEAFVGYLPQGRIAGLSKLARTVAFFSKDLLTQEDLTCKIADFIEERLAPVFGVAVVLKAAHSCMSLRGAKVSGHLTTTSAMRGVFLSNEKHAREEFLALIGNGK